MKTFQYNDDDHEEYKSSQFYLSEKLSTDQENSINELGAFYWDDDGETPTIDSDKGIDDSIFAKLKEFGFSQLPWGNNPI